MHVHACRRKRLHAVVAATAAATASMRACNHAAAGGSGRLGEAVQELYGRKRGAAAAGATAACMHVVMLGRERTRSRSTKQK
jgi:hypothetical protein